MPMERCSTEGLVIVVNARSDVLGTTIMVRGRKTVGSGMLELLALRNLEQQYQLNCCQITLIIFMT